MNKTRVVSLSLTTALVLLLGLGSEVKQQWDEITRAQSQRLQQSVQQERQQQYASETWPRYHAYQRARLLELVITDDWPIRLEQAAERFSFSHIDFSLSALMPVEPILLPLVNSKRTRQRRLELNIKTNSLRDIGQFLQQLPLLLHPLLTVKQCHLQNRTIKEGLQLSCDLRLLQLEEPDEKL